MKTSLKILILVVFLFSQYFIGKFLIENSLNVFCKYCHSSNIIAISLTGFWHIFLIAVILLIVYVIYILIDVGIDHIYEIFNQK